MCQQCPFALYIEQTGEFLFNRINQHKSDIKGCNIQIVVDDHFNLFGHITATLNTVFSYKKLQRKAPS